MKLLAESKYLPIIVNLNVFVFLGFSVNNIRNLIMEVNENPSLRYVRLPCPEEGVYNSQNFDVEINK